MLKRQKPSSNFKRKTTDHAKNRQGGNDSFNKACQITTGKMYSCAYVNFLAWMVNLCRVAMMTCFAQSFENPSYDDANTEKIPFFITPACKA